MSHLTCRLVAIMAGLAVCLTASIAMAGPNDPRLSGYLDFNRLEVEDSRVLGDYLAAGRKGVECRRPRGRFAD